MRNARKYAGLLGVATAMAASFGVERDALACGGCFTPPVPTNEVESVITDERMIFSISKDQTTLYDQIQYSGAPSSFAWVLPIKGTVTVGLSADIMFNLIDLNLTSSQVVTPPNDCPPPPVCDEFLSASAAADAGSALDLGGGSGVTVTAQEQVGPYETVQLHSNDGSALTEWLTSHGYPIAADVAPVIAAYVADQFDFLALKLVPGKGVQSMQPVRVTSKGAALTLPLRMVAIGTGAKTGISIWVVSDGRWEPQNFPFFTISDSELTWDWTGDSSNGGTSNYETVRLAKENTYNGRGWQIESSLELSQFTIEQNLSQVIQYNSFNANPVGGYLATGAPIAADAGAEAGTADAAADGSPEAAVSDAATSNADGGDSGEVFEAGSVGAQQQAATEDLAVLFAGIAGPNVRITRMRSDVAHSALTVDMVLQASPDQSELTNLHYPAHQTGQPACPVYNSSCEETGLLPRDQAIAAANQGGGCSATRFRGRSWTSTALVLGMIGFLAIRIRRRGRRG